MNKESFLPKENNQGEVRAVNPDGRKLTGDSPEPCEDKPTRITIMQFFGQEEKK